MLSSAAALFWASCLIPIFVFLPILKADFVFWDDTINIFLNPKMFEPLNWSWLLWAFSDGDSALRYKPLNWLVWKLWIEAIGDDPWGFHFLSLAFHSLNSGLLFLIICRLLSTPANGSISSKERNVIAFLVCTIWAVHPMKAEPVGWITGFPYLLSTSFLFLSVLFFLESQKGAKEKLYLTISSVAFMGSLLSYPLTMLFPISLFLWDLWRKNLIFFPTINWKSCRLCYHFSLWISSAFILSYNLLINFRGSTVVDYAVASSPISEPTRFIRGVYGISSYIWRWLMPVDLAPVYFNHHFFQLNFWPEACACLVFAGLILFFLFLGIRRSFGWIIGLSSFLALTLPTGGFLSDSITFGDRHAYQGHFIVAVLLAYFAKVFLDMITEEHRKIPFFCLVGSFSIIIFCGSLMTQAQLKIWENTESLMEHVLPKTQPYPGFRSMMLLRLGLAKAGDKTSLEAIEHLREATRIAPWNYDAWHMRGLVALERNLLEDAEKSLTHAYELNPEARLKELLSGISSELERQRNLSESEYLDD